VARGSHDTARRGHRRGDRPSLWPRRVPSSPCSSVLVSVVRLGAHWSVLRDPPSALLRTRGRIYPKALRLGFGDEAMSAAVLQRHGYSVAALRALAQKRLPRILFDMVDGAAGDEITMRRN